MEKVLGILQLFCLLILLPYPSSSLPLCTDLSAPRNSRGNLSFCEYNGKVCCSSAQDVQLHMRFQSMNISDSACSAAVKSILCASCDPFSAQLFSVESAPRPVPILCNSTSGRAVSSLSRTQTGNSSFCLTVWGACQNIEILNSPFATPLQTRAQISQNTTSSTLAELWQSESDFCTAFGGNSDNNSICYSGLPVSLNETNSIPPPSGICLEKVNNGSFLNMVPHPDGSNRAFFSSQAGKIFLADIPDQDSGRVLGIDESSPFVDLTDQVYLDATFGMMGMAFHPNFANNGRFFASMNCDKEKSPGCGGRCACNSDVDCDPSQLGSFDNSVEPCKYHTIIVEYTANGTVTPSQAENARPTQVRRIFTMGLPFSADHGGQILFGPEDGYMYVMMGDGGSKDPYNFAQNKKSLLGKIMRVDVDNIPSEDEIVNQGLWGNYSIPRDNPSSADKDMVPEIWAYGFRNPWRCAFDSARPSYFLCADIGQDDYEEVNLIYKGGNYGWRVYEGPQFFNPDKTPGGNTSATSIDPIFPVAGYSHKDINSLGSAAIMGGYVYRGSTDPCTAGSYLYAELYGGHIWSAAETPENSGNFTSKDIPFNCAPDSPIKCDMANPGTIPALKYVFSFGEDNRKDVYILTQSGVYRVVHPSRCNYACSKEVARTNSPSNPTTSTPSSSLIVYPCSFLVLVISALFLFL